MGTAQSANTNTGLGFLITLSSAVTKLAFGWNLAANNAIGNPNTMITGGVGVASGAALSHPNATIAANTSLPVWGQGILKTTSNTGTAQLGIISETATLVTADAGFVFVVEKVA
jgi:hypothetical protein